MLSDFIADAPEDDAGVVAIAANERPHVFFVPLREEEVIIVASFAADPAVERFVHDDEAQAVAKIEQFGSGRIVAGANGVEAIRLHQFHAAFFGAINGR